MQLTVVTMENRKRRGVIANQMQHKGIGEIHSITRQKPAESIIMLLGTWLPMVKAI